MKINHKKKSLKMRKKPKLRKKTYRNRKRKVVIKVRKVNLRKMSPITNRVIRRRKFLVSL